jgi:hypothetical protein
MMNRFMAGSGRSALLVAMLACCQATALLSANGDGNLSQSSMLRAEPDAGFSITPLFTVGEVVNGYRPPGTIDGLAAWDWDAETVRVFANHELAATAGYPYLLEDGPRLTGSRISYFDIDKQTRAVRDAGLAYRSVRDRQGRRVKTASQINERSSDSSRGFEAFCSAAGYAAGDYGFVDDIFFSHEETSVRKAHPHGGSIWGLDVRQRELWALPALGRGAWENVTALQTPDAARPDGHVALLLSDDFESGAAPLYLWIGRKVPGGTFPERNGLVQGHLHVWVSNSGDRDPEDWHGTGTRRTGRFVQIAARDPGRTGQPGFDRGGYLDDTTLRAAARNVHGAFMFSRPEDLHTNPQNGRQVVFSSTGHGGMFPSDDWGTLYLLDLSFDTEGDKIAGATATIAIVHDADDFGDFGIRSPDNLVWASDGMVYVQEDRATKRNKFGKASGREASVWRLDPTVPKDYERIAEIDRSVVLPADAKGWMYYWMFFRVGAWESSGITDVSQQFGVWPAELLLLASVQAHSVKGGAIGGKKDLVQGGQLVLLVRPRNAAR